MTSASQIKSAQIHNGREFEENNMPVPDNIKEHEKYGNNVHGVMVNGNDSENKSILSALERRLAFLGISPRKNSVKALEYVLALSPDVKTSYDKHYSASGMLDNLTKFVTEKHGFDNVLSISQHFDETNPHVHIIVTPVQEKVKKWKNRHGSGEKKEYTLAARDFTGGREKLREMQTDFFNHVNKWAKSLNTTFYRGEDNRISNKKYTLKTCHTLGELDEQKRVLANEFKKDTRLIDYRIQKAHKHRKESKKNFLKFDPF